MKQRFSSVVLALMLALTFIGIGATPSLPGAGPSATTVEDAAAHPADCDNIQIWTPSATGGVTMATEAYMLCHTGSWKMTVYFCGGVNGSGYCHHGSSTFCSRCGSLDKWISCNIVYSGPYWTYTGVKLQSLTYWGTWGNDRWYFGPGVWLQGSC